jgi:hypothetical protein
VKEKRPQTFNPSIYIKQKLNYEKQLLFTTAYTSATSTSTIIKAIILA